MPGEPAVGEGRVSTIIPTREGRFSRFWRRQPKTKPPVASSATPTVGLSTAPLKEPVPGFLDRSTPVPTGDMFPVPSPKPKEPPQESPSQTTEPPPPAENTAEAHGNLLEHIPEPLPEGVTTTPFRVVPHPATPEPRPISVADVTPPSDPNRRWFDKPTPTYTRRKPAEVSSPTTAEEPPVPAADVRARPYDEPSPTYTRRRPDSAEENNVPSQDGADRFFDSARTRDYVTTAVERLTGEKPSKEQIDVIAKDAPKRVSRVKALGQRLPDFIAGAVSGAATKQLLRIGTSIAGVGGFPIVAGIGAVGGAAAGYTREYLKQRHTLDIGDTPESKSIRQRLKNESRRWSARDKTKLRNAAVRGAVTGAVGGVIGGLIVDHVNLSSVIHRAPGVSRLSGVRDLPGIRNIPGVGGHETGVRIVHAPGTPTPGAETTAIPPGHDVVQGIIPSHPAPTEVPGTGGVSVHPTPEIPGVGGAEHVVPSPMDMPSEDIVKSAFPEGIDLPAGSNPWDAVKGQLTDALGRPPTDDQLRDGVARFLTQNEIVDATKIPAGTHLSMGSVNQLAGEILGSHQLLPADLAALPDSLPLPADLDPWAETSNVLRDYLGRPPTSLQILDITKEVCRQSNIAVPAWDIPGAIDSHNLPAGFMLNFNDEVKRKMALLAS